MKRKIITTKDGSKTIQIEEWNEQYHSVHGAIQEARHVFIKHGLLFYSNSLSQRSKDTTISILEIGFGTGLNAFLSLVEGQKEDLNINYVGVEGYPVSTEEIEQLNYIELISETHSNEFKLMHESSWEAESSEFRLISEGPLRVTSGHSGSNIRMSAFGWIPAARNRIKPGQIRGRGYKYAIQAY